MISAGIKVNRAAKLIEEKEISSAKTDDLNKSKAVIKIKDTIPALIPFRP